MQRNVAVIVSIGGTGLARMVKAATSTIPVIFEAGFDPVQAGLVANLSRPGGSLTGFNLVIGELWPKPIDLMAQLLPNSRIFGLVITDPTTAERQPQLVPPEADALGRKGVIATVLMPHELDAAFAALARQGAEALFIGASALSVTEAEHLAALAAQYSLPAIYGFREIARAGGLMSYGIDLNESHLARPLHRPRSLGRKAGRSSGCAAG